MLTTHQRPCLFSFVFFRQFRLLLPDPFFFAFFANVCNCHVHLNRQISNRKVFFFSLLLYQHFVFVSFFDFPTFLIVHYFVEHEPHLNSGSTASTQINYKIKLILIRSVQLIIHELKRFVCLCVLFATSIDSFKLNRQPNPENSNSRKIFEVGQKSLNSHIELSPMWKTALCFFAKVEI